MHEEADMPFLKTAVEEIHIPYTPYPCLLMQGHASNLTADGAGGWEET